MIEDVLAMSDWSRRMLRGSAPDRSRLTYGDPNRVGDSRGWAQAMGIPVDGLDSSRAHHSGA